jgi:radical SAM protein with 4Fe4S-binding SPASM domain
MSSIQNLSLGWLTVNRACNNRCKWCYAQDSGFNSDVLTKEDARALVGLMNDLEFRHIALIGGEPTLYKNLFNVINLISEKGIKSSITTHGRTFSDKKFAKKFADTGIKDISISMKGINRQKYLQLTNADGFDEAMKGIKNLQEIGLEPGVFFTLDLNAIQEIDETIEFLTSLKLNQVVMNFANPVIVKGKTYGKETPDPRQIAQAYSKIISQLVNERSNFFLAPSIPLCLLDVEVRKVAIKRKMLTGTCYARTGAGLIFSPKGEVLPCHQFANSAMGKFGIDFYDAESFIKFWHGETCQKFRRMMNYYPSVECQFCDDWQYCYGGCPIKWFYFDPKNFIKKEVVIETEKYRLGNYVEA